MIPTRILLIDDHALFRTGLSLVLSANMPGVEVIDAGTLSEAMLSAENHVDIVLLDINLPGLNGLEGIALLKRKLHQVPILILSAQDDGETVRLALARGAAGFISKVECAENVVATIQLVLNGQHSEPRPATYSRALRTMTPRQCEVLDLLSQGLSNKLIADQLLLSENTIRIHVQGILTFFRVKSRAEAVFAARIQGQLS